MNTLSNDELLRALSVRDLSDPAQGSHAMQRLVADVEAAVVARYQCPVQRLRGNPIVRVQDNYDALGYPPDAPARERRYSKYVSEDWMLRTHTSVVAPDWLRSWSGPAPRRLALVTAGLVYRRDRIDRLHTAEPHQLDVWIVLPRGDAEDDAHMVDRAVTTVMAAALPDHDVVPSGSSHPYTRAGEQLDVVTRHGQRIEVGECGRIDPDLLARTGRDPERVTGIAIGLGLDRLLMLRKGLPDIRLLRSEDPRVTAQMETLDPWVAVSRQPPVVRDLSIAAEADLDPDTLGDAIRAALPEELSWLEKVDVLDETPHEALPPAAVRRLGSRPGMKNVVVRLTIRHPERSVRREEANALRNRVYRAVHRGAREALAE